MPHSTPAERSAQQEQPSPWRNNLYITPIPALKDNYIWLIINTVTSNCLIVDPGAAELVLQFISLNKLKPIAILLTHHHHDHCGGVEEILLHYKIPVFGSALENIPVVSRSLTDTEIFSIDELNLRLHALSIPGHTLGHMAYYGEGMLFCGDTLFTGGCGRLFEGTAEQLFQSLTLLASLPESTLIYCGHEYTENNLKFALTIEPNNQTLLQRLQITQQLRSYGIPSVPSSLKLEKLSNPFLRCHEPAVIQAAAASGDGQDPIAVFRSLRKLKDHFKVG